MVAVPERIKRLEQRPWIAHMMRAVQRYLNRLGSQFAAATSYFSVLALVPILMMAFSITGFVLTKVQPGLLDDVANAVAKALAAPIQRLRKRSWVLSTTPSAVSGRLALSASSPVSIPAPNGWVI
jgi:membrane protein